MTPSPFELLALFLAVTSTMIGPLAIAFGHRNYTAEQRAHASRLYHGHLIGATGVSIVGAASGAWILAAGLPSVWIAPALALLPLPVSVIQRRLHGRMGYSGWLGP